VSNESNTDLQITPLTLWVGGGLCAALWGVLFGIGMATLNKQSTMQDNVTKLVTSQAYDRREIDNLQDDVNAVKVEVGTISNRLGKLESRR